jgi:hypothetical protein
MVGILLISCSPRENFRRRSLTTNPRDGTWHRDDIENSLNAGVRCRKGRGRSNLAEQVFGAREN